MGWAFGHCSVGYRSRAWVMKGTVQATLSFPLPGGPSGSSRALPLPRSAPRIRGLEDGGQTYTMAFLGHSSEVRYHVITLLTGTVPLKYSRQHSLPTLVPRAAEEEAGAGACVSVCGRGEGVWWVRGCVSVCLWRGVCMLCLCVCCGRDP